MMVEGLWLMAVGMGTVFAFLLLLVACMHVAAAAFASFPDDPAPVVASEASTAPDEELMLIAVALAIAERERA